MCPKAAGSAASARAAWLQAHEESSCAPFAPFLERNVELRRELSAHFPEAEHPYDPLLDDFEPGMRTADARAALERLRDGLVPLVAGVTGTVTTAGGIATVSVDVIVTKRPSA